jgi:hypothetical protein
MNTRLLVTLSVCLCTPWSAALCVSLGDTREAVIQELGTPEATAVPGEGEERLHFAQGEIRLRQGRVFFIQLRSAEAGELVGASLDMRTKLRIAELEARIASLRSRLGQAEAEVEAMSRHTAVRSWIPSSGSLRNEDAGATTRRFPFPRRSVDAGPDIHATASTHSSRGL